MNKTPDSKNSIFASIFGKLNWNCPPWLGFLRDNAKARPVRFWGFVLLIAALLATAAYAAHWYSHLPKPQLTTAVITTPKITAIAETLVPDNLIINFGLSSDVSTSRSVAPIALVGKDVSEGVTLSPELEGEWVWESDSRLVFTPSTDWPAGQTYTVHFADDFFAPGTKMESHEYPFSTLPFQANISDFTFYQDPVNVKVRQAVATLNFNFPVDPASLENAITLALQQDNSGKQKVKAQSYQFTVTYDEFKRVAYLHSENLSIPDVSQYLLLTLNKGIKSATHSAETQTAESKVLLIPDTSTYFKVNSATASIIRNEKDQPEQILNIETSLGVTEKELGKSLHVYILPINRPESSTRYAVQDYPWQNPGEVSDDVLLHSIKLPLEAIPADRNYATLHSYKLVADPTRYLYLKIDKGTHGFGDFVLSHGYEAVMKVPELPKEIRFLHNGALLALNSEKKLSVLVRGLSAVKFDIARVLPENVNQLVTQTQGEFNNPYFIHQSFNQQNISELYSEVQTFDGSDLTKQQYSSLDLGKYLTSAFNKSGPQGLFLLKASGWDTVNHYELNVTNTRMILITNLGLLVKDNNDGSHDVFVQSITEGVPAAGVDVSVLGKNGLPVLTRTTDEQGHVSFPGLKDFVADREPVAYLARQGNDVSFIPYNNYNRQLNFSRFDIGGIYTNQDLHSLSAFVFSDRGLYRPGDTAHFGMMVKQAYAQPQPAGLPLQVIITDPRGVTVYDQKYSLDEAGLLTVDFATQATSPTGQYSINLYTVKDNRSESLLGSTTFRVAEFQPDRMRISASLSPSQGDGWVSPQGLMAKIGLWNLYGRPAEGRRVSGKLVLSPKAVQFAKYPDYVFADPLLDPNKAPKNFTDTLTDTKTDAQGEAQFDLNLERFDKATYQLTFFAEGFEAEGGRSVTTQVSALVSPMPWFVGYKSDGDLRYIKSNSPRQVRYIAINPQLEKVAVGDLKIQLLSLHPATTLVKKPDGTYQYQSIIQSSVLSTTAFAISDKGNDYVLPTNQPGDFALVLVDSDKTELSRLNFRVVGESQSPLAKNAELTVTLNKTEYLAGEDIELQITAPYTGSGLITIERDKVYMAQWFKTETSNSVQTIHIPADFQGNGYVNVAFVRNWDSPEIFISPLSYALVPFTMNNQEHAVRISLDTPKLARPGEQFPITYSSDKPGKIIVFAVDEGILQVSKYLTPNPLAFFFQKHALEVLTQQTLDQILPDYIRERELSSVGGDDSEGELSSHLNPFKRKTDLPVVYWSGSLDTDASPHELTFTIPDYFNGSLRVMAVAISEDSVGSTDKLSEVRGHFVISPNVPTFVAPGDEFEVTSAIANNVENSGDNPEISVNLTVSPGLEVIGSSRSKKTIGEGHEQSVSYRLRAKSLLGSANVTLVATLGNKSSTTNATLSIRPASTFMTSINSGSSKQVSKTLSVDRELYPEYRSVDAVMSTSPLILVAGLQRFLEAYPYGCTEQITSMTFPVLALANYPWLTHEAQVGTDNVNATIAILAQRQMSSGAFTYWPNAWDNRSNPFASVYAMHFLTTARAQNYNVPNDMFYSGTAYLRELAAQNPTSMDSARLQAYAIYVLTRNEIITSNYLTNLLRYLEKEQATVWQTDITSAYVAATYQLLQNSGEADRLIGLYQYQAKTAETSDFYDEGTANAQYLYLLSKHFPHLAQKREALINPLVNALNSGEINTVFAAYASLALSAYTNASPTLTRSSLSISELLSDNTQTLLATAGSGYARAKVPYGVKQIILGNPDKQSYFYQLTQAGFDSTVSTEAINNGLEVYREYRSLDSNEVIDSTGLGSEIEVRIRVRALNDAYLTNIAIVDLLPGGFEVMRESVAGDSFEYADVREDRVVFFVGAGSAVKEMVYHIKATNQGEFTVPAIFAQSMYNPGINARGAAGKMAVTAAP